MTTEKTVDRECLRVLLVEDRPEDAELAVRELRLAGFTVESQRVETEAAYRSALSESWDVILCDHNLPQFDGHRALEILKAQNVHTPFILLSGKIGEDLAVQALKNGASDYLLKDRMTRLGPAVEQAVRQAALLAEKRAADRALRRLSGQLMKAQDAERRRIARELHDSTAQKISALLLELQGLRSRMGAAEPRTEEIFESISQLAEDSLGELSGISYLLHPPMLDEAGLGYALRWYVGGFAKRTGIAVELHMPDDIGRLPQDVETTLFRVVQESLGNIHRHSGSSGAWIDLIATPASVRLEIRDSGRGIPKNQKMDDSLGHGVGIAGMRERVGQLNGEFGLESGPKGTRLTIDLPLED